jgi:hypothetical protein
MKLAAKASGDLKNRAVGATSTPASPCVSPPRRRVDSPRAVKVREALAKARALPKCALCHAVLPLMPAFVCWRGCGNAAPPSAPAVRTCAAVN